MDPQLRELLIAKGMDKNASDADAIAFARSKGIAIVTAAEAQPAAPGQRPEERAAEINEMYALGLAEGGVDYAMDDNNAPLVDDDMKAAVEAAKAAIIAGEISVHDYMSDNNCPY